MGKIERKCLKCEKVFRYREDQLKRGPAYGTFCSLVCKNTVIGSKNLKNYVLPKGPEHRLWKGGRSATLAKRVRDPIKERARSVIYRGVKNGSIKREPCEVCGDEQSEAHHKDYKKPLDVEWLCRRHHKIADLRDGTKSGDFGH